jgi:hypothetical protein
VHEGQGHQQSPNRESEQDASKLSLRHLLYDIQIHQTAQKGDDEDEKQEISQMRRLAGEVLKLMWEYCMENVVANAAPDPSYQQRGPSQSALLSPDNNTAFGQTGRSDNQIFDYLHRSQRLSNSGSLSPQVHSMAIENFCQVLNYHFPSSSFFFMNLCVQNLKRNKSVVSSQMILEKLIRGTAFPISLAEKGGPSSQAN